MFYNMFIRTIVPEIASQIGKIRIFVVILKTKCTLCYDFNSVCLGLLMFIRCLDFPTMPFNTST